MPRSPRPHGNEYAKWQTLKHACSKRTRRVLLKRQKPTAAYLGDSEGFEHGVLEGLEVMLHVLHHHEYVVQLAAHNHLRTGVPSQFFFISFGCVLLFMFKFASFQVSPDSRTLLKS